MPYEYICEDSQPDLLANQIRQSILKCYKL